MFYPPMRSGHISGSSSSGVFWELWSVESPGGWIWLFEASCCPPSAMKYQSKGIGLSCSPVESPLCWGQQWDTRPDIAIKDTQNFFPQRSRHYVGVLVFWLDWQDQKTGQHHNHFGILGSSPLGSGEGSLHKRQRMIYLWSSKWGIRLGMKHKGGLSDLVVRLSQRSLTEKVMEWKEKSSRMFRQKRIGQESVNPLGYGVMKGNYLQTTKQGFHRESHLY